MVQKAILDHRDAIEKTPILERITAIKDTLKQAGDEGQRARRLPAFGSKALADAGLYRHGLPRELGGEDMNARQQIEVIEACAAIDGSVGWCVQISSEINALVIRRMDPAFAHQIYDTWEAVICSGLGTPNGPNPGRWAKREGDGWRLNYQGSFASNCYNATWNFVMGMQTIDPDTGKPADASFMVPKGEFEIVDTWDTAGMRGSGSHDVRMAECYVRREHLLPRDSLGACEIWGNPTHRNPLQVIYNKAAVSLGVCKGALESFMQLAQGKVPWGTSTTLKDLGPIQDRIGRAMAEYIAVRSAVIETQERLEDHLGPLPSKGGRLTPEWEFFWPAQLASTHAAQKCREIVSELNNMSGTTGSRLDSPLERQLRDAHQAASHGAVSWRHYQDVGKTLIGHEIPPGFSIVTRA